MWLARMARWHDRRCAVSAGAQQQADLAERRISGPERRGARCPHLGAHEIMIMRSEWPRAVTSACHDMKRFCLVRPESSETTARLTAHGTADSVWQGSRSRSGLSRQRAHMYSCTLYRQKKLVRKSTTPLCKQ